ncbi:hypothetical protein L1987_02572 [Smallanthus sonchifolius]|uniref:Uncharacterized protein n=1 Tax=Smallanthus sonchifolius TaxID=185202 RepID=A0ACB9K866_9ASTR|nr:hypothetical protein L1987_02572 [Smallanthus sonchifolius]
MCKGFDMNRQDLGNTMTVRAKPGPAVFKPNEDGESRIEPYVGWTKNAKYGILRDADSGGGSQDFKALMVWSLREEAHSYIDAGAASIERYKLAFEILQEGENPLRSRTFIFAFIVATIAMLSFLCGKKKRKRSRSLKKQTATTKADENTDLFVSTTNDATHVEVEDKNDDPPVQNENKELLPPPRLASIRAASYHAGGSSSRSQGAKLTSSMSMRLSGGFKGLKKGLKNDEKGNDLMIENDKMTRGDSLLKKTIILGEKCRIPDEDEDDIILDENGQRITTFHRKQSCSSMPRQSSNTNRDVFLSEHEMMRTDRSYPKLCKE